MPPINGHEKKFIDQEDVQVAFTSKEWRRAFVDWLHEHGVELWQLPNTAPDGGLTMEDPEEDFLTFSHRPIGFKGE